MNKIPPLLCLAVSLLLALTSSFVAAEPLTLDSDEMIIDEVAFDALEAELAADDLASTMEQSLDESLSDIEILEQVIDQAFADDIEFQTGFMVSDSDGLYSELDTHGLSSDAKAEALNEIVDEAVEEQQTAVARGSGKSVAEPEALLNQLDDSSLMDFVAEDDWYIEQLNTEVDQ